MWPCAPKRNIGYGCLPQLGEMIQDEMGVGVDKVQVDELVANEFRENLY